MTKTIAIIGGGPSGLMAADILSVHGYPVTIYERKPTFGRKFLMAGRGGLNITHSEPLDDFIKKYGAATPILKPLIENFSPQDLRNWCEKLGETTFIGSSGRIFPQSFKASPLLRSWLARLEKQNVIFKNRHEWKGWSQNKIFFETNGKEIYDDANITILSLGGASWPSLGSDGSWVSILEKENIKISPLKPSNCGFEVKWSDLFTSKFEGQVIKTVVLSFKDKKIHGEFIITKNGVEGGAIYALSSALREEITLKGSAELIIDLKPDLTLEEIINRLQRPRSKSSMSNFLRKTLNLSDVAIGLIMERPDHQQFNHYTPPQLAEVIKSYTLPLKDPFSLDRAISTAGGITFEAVDENFMLINKPNIFIAGEMLDWEAPTGGYLLHACFASGFHVAHAIIKNYS